MSETATHGEFHETQDSGFSVVRTFHPTVYVPNLREAEASYQGLFGIASVEAETHGAEHERPGYRNEYESCVSIRDVWFATVAPHLCIRGGVQRLPSVDAAQFNGFGWYVDDVQAVFDECGSHGIRLVNTYEQPLDEVMQFGPYRLFCTAPDATGLRYSIFQETKMALDPRTDEGWVLPPVSSEDPLGITTSSHHTILTGNPDRALKFVVDVLGGTVIHEGRNELLGATSTYVYVTDGVVEYAVPDSGTAAYERWARGIPNDTYYSITWQVNDLKLAEAHLQGQGVVIQARSADAFITDPSTSMLRWGFSTVRVPGDPREV